MRLVLFPIMLSLVACGGSSDSASSSSDNNGGSNPVVDSGDSNNPDSMTQAIDCSIDSSQALRQPLPEYPGRQYGYVHSGSNPAGFDPESYFTLSSGGLLLGMMNSEEGLQHLGPQWTIIQDQLTKTINYSQNDEGEHWSIRQTGVDRDGFEHQQRTTLEIIQKPNCDLAVYSYDETGVLETEYNASIERSSHRTYRDGELTGTMETLINSDRSGVSISRSLTNNADYPVTVLQWDHNGDMTLMELCKNAVDFEGTDCVAATGG